MSKSSQTLQELEYSVYGTYKLEDKLDVVKSTLDHNYIEILFPQSC